ncbi:protein sneaky-like [Lineus longissimus]|uniref:protein sneaky-like n=1 Tax=Lineus longissimus TaxID=88925 RepID=UPI00315CD95E
MPCISCADTWWPAVGRCFKRGCPKLHEFLHSPQNQFACLKRLLGFPFGLALGVALYWGVIDGMLLPRFIRLSLGGVICISLATGYSLSTQVRCISLLVLPTFCGKTGRAYIQTFAIALVLSGPIANIVYHAGEVPRSIGCSTELSTNHSATRLELKLRPIQEIMMDLRGQTEVVHNTSLQVKKEFSPIENEVENKEEVKFLKGRTGEVDGGAAGSDFSRSSGIEKKYKQFASADVATKNEKNYEKKLDYRCEDVYNVGVLKCRQFFKNAEQGCKMTFTLFAFIICLPMKMTAICEITRLLPSITGVNCNSMEAVNPGFGEGYKAADDAAKGFDKNFDVKMQYKVETPEEPIDVTTSQDVSKAITHEFEARSEWFYFVVFLAKQFMSFLFIRVFMSSFKYHKNYISLIQFDNKYMTSYFRHIEKRRILQKKRGLLPLKQIEAKDVIASTRCSLTSDEKSKFMTGSSALFLRLIMILVIFFVDHLIWEIMNIIYSNSRVDYKQTGVHHIKLTIYGNGFIGNLVRTLFRGFNKKHAINSITSNFKCLPRPHKLPTEYLIKVLAIYGGIWLLMLVQAFGLRLRRVVAGFFYPKREKKRVLFLYNEMLKKRRGYVHHMRSMVKSLAKENKLSMQTGLLMSWRHTFPRLCGCLRVLGLGKKQCLICKEPENKDFYFCETKGCNFVYCKECWEDLKVGWFLAEARHEQSCIYYINTRLPLACPWFTVVKMDAIQSIGCTDAAGYIHVPRRKLRVSQQIEQI